MLTVICSYCHALYFDCEKLRSSLVNFPKFGMCCLQGQIQLPPLQLLTVILYNYLTRDNYPSREFCNNIQQYNTAFAMTSVDVRIANSWAGIKPTALLSVFDKENSIEFSLDLLHYIYNYYGSYAPCLPQSSCPSGDPFVTSCDCDFHCDMTWHDYFCD